MIGLILNAVVGPQHRGPSRSQKRAHAKAVHNANVMTAINAQVDREFRQAEIDAAADRKAAVSARKAVAAAERKAIVAAQRKAAYYQSMLSA